MTKLGALVLLGLGAACSEPVPIRFHYSSYEDNKLYVEGGEPEPLVGYLEDATGLDFMQVDSGAYGVLEVEFVDVRPNTLFIGRAFKRGHCRRSARSTRSPVVLVHEVGHLLGLEHLPAVPGNEHNFMYPREFHDYEDGWFSEWQLDRLEENASWFVGCIP